MSRNKSNALSWTLASCLTGKQQTMMSPLIIPRNRYLKYSKWYEKEGCIIYSFVVIKDEQP